ncbi:MAG: 1-acyl-sn-glycerol-3-phosphate acyltransferase [Clostridia bacterium]|nr:1-acyl-sn-glycerol-3-phosphate acyltransferase [Clostridia bacterium]
MDKRKRHRRAWRLAYKLLHRHLEKKFNLTSEKCDYDAPCLIVSNHVTNWDPVLVGLSFPNRPTYFVASEHLFRMGIKTKLLNRYFEPIPRSKGSSAVDTVLKCLRHFKAGDSVCIFAEGDSTWNGVTQDIVPSTANLAKSSRVALVTYRF